MTYKGNTIQPQRIGLLKHTCLINGVPYGFYGGEIRLTNIGAINRAKNIIDYLTVDR